MSDPVDRMMHGWTPNVDATMPMYEREQHPDYPAMGWFRPTKHNWNARFE
jgi:hypothetical protein